MVASQNYGQSLLSKPGHMIGAACLLDPPRIELLLRYDKAASNKFKDATRMLCELRGVASLAALLASNVKVSPAPADPTLTDFDLPSRNGLLNGRGYANHAEVSSN